MIRLGERHFELPPHRFLRHIFVVALIALLGFRISSSQARDLSGAVRIGAELVPATDVEHALEDCESSAPDLSPRECLDRYFVPRWLLDAEARARNLGGTGSYEHTRADLLHAALVEQIARTTDPPAPAEVDAFLKKHARDFEKPLRIRVFRIMLADEEKARTILKQLGPTTTLTDFRALAREHSLDRATHERGGDLGFLWPDGSTDVPQVRAEPSLYEAAARVVDGEFVTEPVQEGSHFAVVWRRGSLPAVPLNEASRNIAKLRLVEGQTEATVNALLKKFASRVKARDDSSLGKLRRPEATLFKEP